MTGEPGRGASLAVAALGVLAVDPLGLGGIQLQVRPGPHLREWLDKLRSVLPADTPFRRLPARVDPGRLVGELDAVESLRTGARAFRRGLLSEYHGGVLVVPMAERMPPEQATLLGQVLDTGTVAPRGAGGHATPGRVALILLDESRGDEPGPPELLTERVAPLCRLDPRTRGAPSPAYPSPESVAGARARLDSVRVPAAATEAVAALALRMGIPSMRAPLAALRVARASAALAGRREVADDDLALAASLVLLPRALHPPAFQPEEPQPHHEAPPPEGEGEDSPSSPGDRPMADRVLDSARARLPEDFEPLAPAVGGGRSGRRGALIRQLRQGHRVGARPGDPRREGRVDIAATLRTAAPWQRLRRARGGRSGARLLLTAGDLHVQIRARHSATATVFVVDASGSQALHRLAEAKGAVELLLADSYVRREEVALVAFRGRGAEVLLPPTRSLVRARRALAGLPGGGGTPLALGILEGLTLARRLRAAEASPRIVLLSDGRPNVDREGKGGRTKAREDALAASRLVRDAGIPLLVLDTSMRGEAFAGTLAAAGGGRHLHLPRADARTVRSAIGTLDG